MRSEDIADTPIVALAQYANAGMVAERTDLMVYLRMAWEAISNNSLLSGIMVPIVGAIASWILRLLPRQPKLRVKYSCWVDPDMPACSNWGFDAEVSNQGKTEVPWKDVLLVSRAIGPLTPKFRVPPRSYVIDAGGKAEFPFHLSRNAQPGDFSYIEIKLSTEKLVRIPLRREDIAMLEKSRQIVKQSAIPASALCP